MLEPNPSSQRGTISGHRQGCACIQCGIARNRAKAAVNGSAGISAQLATKDTTEALERPTTPQETLSSVSVTPTFTQIAKVPEAPLGPLNADDEPDTPRAPRMPLRDRVVQYIFGRQQGMTQAEIAQKMGIRHTTLSSILAKATKAGLLEFDLPADRLEHELPSRIVDNIKEFLGPTAEDNHRLKMTIEAAKGMGLFKSHQAVKIDGPAAGTILALNIQFQDSSDGVQRQAGNIVGTPKTIDVEVIK